MVSISAKAAARKLKSEGDTDKEALKIMNLQCPNCRDVFFFDRNLYSEGCPFFLDMDGLGMAWLGMAGGRPRKSPVFMGFFMAFLANLTKKKPRQPRQHPGKGYF